MVEYQVENYLLMTLHSDKKTQNFLVEQDIVCQATCKSKNAKSKFAGKVFGLNMQDKIWGLIFSNTLFKQGTVWVSVEFIMTLGS